MKIKFVQLESQAFLTDLDFITMSAAERGVYCTLILHLSCNDGKCRFDPQALARLCNCDDFEKVWERISKKFQTRKGVIRHKRVTKEIKRAKQFVQRQRRAGLASAKKRQPRFNRGSTAVEPTKTKGNVIEKGSEAPTNTNEQALSSSTSVRPALGLTPDVRRPRASPPRSGVEGVESIGSIVARQGILSGERLRRDEAVGGADQNRGLHFHDALVQIIRPRNQSDRTCFRKVANWLTRGCATGRFTHHIFGRVLDLAEEAKTGRNPAAVFMALIKKELEYRNE